MTEAEIFGKYLLGNIPNQKSVILYVDAMNKLKISLDKKEEKLLQFMLRNPNSVKWIDSGLAMFRKESPIRKKLLVMSAILETIPEYANLFFPKRTSIIYVFWVGFRAGFKAMIGGLMIKFI